MCKYRHQMPISGRADCWGLGVGVMLQGHGNVIERVYLRTRIRIRIRIKIRISIRIRIRIRMRGLD